MLPFKVRHEGKYIIEKLPHHISLPILISSTKDRLDRGKGGGREIMKSTLTKFFNISFNSKYIKRPISKKSYFFIMK